jgi:hypothetical protein
LSNKIGIDKLLNILKAEIILDNGWLRGDISMVYGSALMSDILLFSRPNLLLSTGLMDCENLP